MKQTIPAALSALVLALAAGSAGAQVANGNFNTLAGWSVGGDGAAVGGKLVLTTASASFVDDNVGGVDLAAGARNVSGHDPLAAGFDLEAFAGVAPGAFDPDPAHFVVAYEGSAASQGFAAAAGSTLSFKWDLSTLETSSDPSVADVAFVVIDGQVITLANSLAATSTISGGDYASQTGWLDFSTTFANGGSHTIAFGVVDVGQYTDTSALSVSAVNLSAVPESSGVAMMAAGLGLLALQARRRRKS